MDNNKIVQGKDKILLFRKLGESSAALKLLFQVEHTFEFSRELDTIVTKDGTIVKDSGIESEVPIEAVQAKNDPAYEMLQNSVINGEMIEVWEVTLDEEMKEGSEYPGIYARGRLDSWSIPANVEDEATISSTLIVEGVPQFGTTPIPAGLEESLSQYGFVKLTAGGAISASLSPEKLDSKK